MKIEILTINTPNKNNRVYPMHVVENAINQVKERVANGQFFVTIQQPPTPTVPLMDVAAVIRNINVEGDNVVAEFETLDNYNGTLLKDGLESGQLFLRTSGMGTFLLNDAGINVIQDGYEMICIFATNEPA